MNEGEGETHGERDRKREGKNMDWRAYFTESKHQRSVIIEGQTILQRRFILIAEKRNEMKEIIHEGEKVQGKEGMKIGRKQGRNKDRKEARKEYR